MTTKELTQIIAQKLNTTNQKPIEINEYAPNSYYADIPTDKQHTNSTRVYIETNPNTNTTKITIWQYNFPTHHLNLTDPNFINKLTQIATTITDQNQ